MRKLLPESTAAGYLSDIAADYVATATARLGCPVEAAGMFRRYATPMVGAGRAASLVAAAMSRTMTRFAPSEVPRRFLIAVTDSGVHLLAMGRTGIEGEAAAWDRSSLSVLVETTRRGVELLIQPPGDRRAVECLGVDVPSTRQVVAALTSRRDAAGGSG